MKRILSILCVTLLMTSCSSGNDVPENQNSNKENSNFSEEDDEDDTGTEEAPSYEGDAFTAKAVVDGPDGLLYFEEPRDYFPEYDVLKVIPEKYGDTEIQSYMLAIVAMDFELYGVYSKHTGGVMLYYDEGAEHLVAAYNVMDGKPEGKVSVFYPDGKLMLKRTFSNGKWISSEKELMGVDWTFNQMRSSLSITDTARAISYHEDTMIVSLMRSMHYGLDNDNKLWTIMEKSSFNNAFTVNDAVFTGKLLAYFDLKGLEPDLFYELNFKDGWLHGDIRINNDWGELDLHERFTEGKLDTVLFQMEYGDGVAKPLIYLYPEEEMAVRVNLQFDGKMTHTYPVYEQGWRVNAKPDGTLTTADGKEYYGLYWEGQNRREFTTDEGFVVPGDKTTEFLEKSLAVLGLDRREANEFIIYWLPRMEDNAYNFIHFASDEYEDMARLRISPQPESVIRVMMVYQPLDQYREVKFQDLNRLKKERKGFTVVEWGGTEVEGVAVF